MLSLLFSKWRVDNNIKREDYVWPRLQNREDSFKYDA